MLIKINGQLKHSMVNGPGVRYVIFMQGCPHNCPGCHNPDTHDIQKGKVADTDFILMNIISTKALDGITVSGGEPFMQPEALHALVFGAKSLGRNVWVYTGYQYEQIASGELGADALAALHEIDVLVDGRFIESLKSDECIWRGSTNQRLVDVKASLEAGHVVPYVYTN